MSHLSARLAVAAVVALTAVSRAQSPAAESLPVLQPELFGPGDEEPGNLGDSINTRGGEIEPWIAPDESYLIFSGANRVDGVGGYDLFIARRLSGVWERARPLPKGVNTPAYEYNQSVSPDGKWLYFSSTRSVFDAVPARPLSYDELQKHLTGSGNGLGDIYRIEMAKILPH